MKYISLSVALSIALPMALTGCKSTPLFTQSQTEDKPDNISVDSAKPSEIHGFLIQNPTPLAQEVIVPATTAKVVEYANVWQRIKSNLVLEIPFNETVIKHRNNYLKHPKALNNLLKRSEPFIFYIIEELEKNNIPIEIALLPLVESAFDPYARSSVNASGLWQFIPDTGKQFGLAQNWWYDGRRDIVASTQAAIKYLNYLHKFFDGDWMLALAAYNSGEGRVQRAMRKNARKHRPTDYWELALPKETRDYVPKLLAIIDIIDRADEFKIDLYPIKNTKVVSSVVVDSQIDLTVAATLADLPLAEFKRLNPGFNQWATDPNNSTSFLLPEANALAFKNKISSLPQKDRMLWQRYQIKQGDSLGKIAQSFKVDIQSIKRINKISGSNIRAGKHLLIPVSSNGENYTPPIAITSNSSKGASSKSKHIHIVKAGDTLWDISKAYKVSSKNIANWNNISTKSMLKLGQKLVIWNKNKVSTITYKVKRGDSFARIANKFNVSIKELEMWNNLKRKDYLQPGQKLKIALL